MPPQLADIARQLDELAVRVHRYYHGDEAAFLRPPAERAWSAAQCIRHLSLTTEAFLTPIDEALARPDKRQVGADHRYRADLIGRFLRWLLEPPFRTKTKTTTPFVPIAVSSRAAVIAEFEQLQQALSSRVAKCAGRDLERMRIVSPFNSAVKYNLYAALTIVTAHQRRHLWQADEALESARKGASR